MARRSPSTRRKRSVRRKTRTAKPAKAPAPSPVTVPPFGRETNPPSGWNVQDQSADEVARLYAERQRRNIAGTFGGEGNTFADAYVRRPPETIHTEILRHIDAIEEIIPQLPGRGHNKPPELIEPPPLTDDEIAEIQVHIALVRGLPPKPDALPTALGRAWERLKWLGEKIKTAATITTAAATITTGAATLWHQLGDHLTAAGNLLAEWIKVLMHFL